MILGNKFHSESINKWHARWNVSFCLHSERHNALRCPKTPQRRPPGSPRRTQSAPKTPPRRLTTPSGWSQLRPAAPKAAKKPSKPRFWTLWTSSLDPPDLDFGPSIRRFSILQTLLCYFSIRRGGGDAALLRVGMFCFFEKANFNAIVFFLHVLTFK